jgi:RHH-type transcriptional regulator, proline utilization regulon repressor / proline dehydrogenase / delta 1-pyrroline-5-carboxylate dehydrogenase
MLMCLAESLLRVPDAATADKLIRDKIGSGDWERHLNRSDSLFVNASTYGLLLTGRVVSLDETAKWDFAGIWRKLLARSSEPVIRQAVTIRHAHPGQAVRAWSHDRRSAEEGARR